jgi:starch phosphorylase
MEVKKFFVKPRIPESLKKLFQLAFNIWSYWDKDAERLYSRIDTLLYSTTRHNLALMLQEIDPAKLEKLGQDKGFIYELEKVYRKFREYIDFEGTYYDGEEQKIQFHQDRIIAYISMEYGLHESIPIYSGGLGILSGDYLKAASDVGIPFVGFGLLYKYGYFNQKINFNGYQEEEYCENRWYTKAVEEVKDPEGNPLVIQVPVRDELFQVKIWKIQVGKIPLYLLDTDMASNSARIRSVTDMLYDSDRDKRIMQELVLGRGCVILCQALNIDPVVYHLNEGHSAFLIVERLMNLMSNGKYSFEEARTLIRHSTVFTTHTPVIEGNENYDAQKIIYYLESEIRQLGLTNEAFLKLGQKNGSAIFWLPAFAIHFSRFINGVSKIHAQVSREMWKELFPNCYEKEIPIDHVTNGVHAQTWLSQEMTYIFDRYLGPDYLHQAESAEVWEKIYSTPDSEIWSTHLRRKEQLISFIRNRIIKDFQAKGRPMGKIKKVQAILNPHCLTLGFARRFAPYKRASLILRDPERLIKLLKHPEKPIQIIFAGKAHPADQKGKELIKEILDFAKKYDVEDRLVFVEDYNMNVAKHLVQGVDIWLNNPLKPLEASGTSGMKAGINGILNLSILDGWWPECYNGENGWAITAGDGYENYDMKCAAEANQVYELLEDEITEIYYQRNENNVPAEWVRRMKNSIYTVGKGFNMHRVIRAYLYKYYLPQALTHQKLEEEGGALLKELGQWKKKIDQYWDKIYIKDFSTGTEGKMPGAGETIQLKAYVYLDDADPSDYMVELLYLYSEEGEEPARIKMHFVKRYEDKSLEYEGHITLKGSGIQGVGIKLFPAWELFIETFPGYIKWK